MIIVTLQNGQSALMQIKKKSQKVETYYFRLLYILYIGGKACLLLMK